MRDKKVAFIGAGNMAEALIKGILGSGLLPASSITACDTDPARLEYFEKTYGVKTSGDNEEGARSCDVLLLSVKPRDMDRVLTGIRGSVKASHLVISIAAGVTLRRLESALGEGVPVVRAMPNGPALVGRGMTAISRGASVADSDMETTRELLGAAGEVMEVGEDLMDAVTAVSGSGPAYFFYLVEALAAAARAAGFSVEDADRLAAVTAVGSMRWLDETGSSPAGLREKVTSPGGTTEAAIRTLEEKGLRELIADAVDAAIRRSRELGGD